ncbi:hypothetical protein BKA04_001180 [Cryobacterium mesophilum]|uniref:Uncharacterized protein n=1 Tax=Terrimesophilobacter mesophilus TaxID=433647 RepID=A0A4V3I9J7_9MICO|nr:hypothetical protein [Terrimesophilobacter mesophilus]MBB5632957.1 hypothetical protein [Terrimesophilobacter mesophilus]TFB79728.1 hypothetical protein E3N84_06530 [Terrimesophilobacter mesophilus]
MRRGPAVAVALALLSGVLIGVGVTGCTPVPASESAILSGPLPADVSAQNVVLAAILLRTSDIDAAVADGLVTPAEVDAAKLAIEQGTVDLWRQRAESDRNR